MEKYTTNILTVERKGIFDKSIKKRFELTFTCKEAKNRKSILVIGLSPASDNISNLDTTTTFILNNLIPMGYTTITICNLYADLFKERLKPSEVPDNEESRKYMEEVLKRDFDTILLGYGNTFQSSKPVIAEKKYLRGILEKYKEKVVDIVDEKGEYSRLKATHPLMAGRYFTGKWKLRPFVFEKEKSEDKKSTKSKAKAKEKEVNENEESHPNQDSKPVVCVETDESLSGQV